MRRNITYLEVQQNGSWYEFHILLYQLGNYEKAEEYLYDALSYFGDPENPVANEMYLSVYRKAKFNF